MTTTANNNNNKKEAGVFLDSAPSAAVKRQTLEIGILSHYNVHPINTTQKAMYDQKLFSLV